MTIRQVLCRARNARDAVAWFGERYNWSGMGVPAGPFPVPWGWDVRSGVIRLHLGPRVGEVTTRLLVEHARGAVQLSLFGGGTD